MNIAAIANHVWLQSHTVAFGKTNSWPDDLFTKSWADATEPKLLWRTYQAGWYWLLVDLTLAELKMIERPTTLPPKGCDIGALSRSNDETFGADLLCKPGENGSLVVYNGHESKISDRVRAHFALNSDSTGAIGLKHFSLHKHSWEVRVFAAPCLGSLPIEVQPRVQLLMSSKSGRCAVETAWRAVYEWPVLCKV